MGSRCQKPIEKRSLSLRDSPFDIAKDVMRLTTISDRRLMLASTRE